MEFLLPVALKLFPNMLPSTFEDKFAAVSLTSQLAMPFNSDESVFLGREAAQASACQT